MRYDFYRATLTSKIQRASIALVLLVASLYPAGAFIFNLSRNGAEAIASISHIAPDTGPIAGGQTVAIGGAGLLQKNRQVVQSAAGKLHAMVLTSDNKVYAWGANMVGQLGNGTTVDSAVPIEVNLSALQGKTITSIAAAGNHSMLLTSDGQVYVWGGNIYGESSNAVSGWHGANPVHVNALATVVIKQIAAGDLNSMAVDANGALYVWGDNTYGQFGNGTTNSSNIPLLVAPMGDMVGKTVKHISTGGDFNGYGSTSITGGACAIASDDKVYCWGSGSGGRLGNGSTNNSSVPVAVSVSATPAMNSVKKLSNGSGAACAIASDDKLYCWGSASYGSLGNGVAVSSIPVAVSQGDMPSSAGIKDVTVTSGGNGAPSRSSICAIASDDKAYCWGDNGTGQLGDGTNTNSSVPVATTSTLINGPADFTIKLDDQYCTDLTTGANNITTNFAPDGSWVKCATPAHSEGRVNVTVSNGIDTGTLNNAYTYYAPMTITGVMPNNGITLGGQTVTITGNNLAPPARTPTTMQEMNGAYCAIMPVDQVIVLPDIRNGQTYRVKKMQDNKCWMIDNLKLELTDGQVLAPDTTAVVANTTVSFNKTVGTWSGNFKTSGYLTADNTDSSTLPNYDAWGQANPSSLVYCTNPTGGAFISTTDGVSTTGCGYVYNFYTATAGTAPQTTTSGTAAGSICPAGWRLPTAYTHNTSTDFPALDVAYGGIGGNVVDAPTINTLWVSTGAWHGVFGGVYVNSMFSTDNAFHYWSSTVY